MEQLNRYLTEAEKEQMDAILSKAMERMAEDGGRAAEDGCQFLFTKCRKEKEEGKEMLEINCKVDVKSLVKEICSACPRCVDEELPFR